MKDERIELYGADTNIMDVSHNQKNENFADARKIYYISDLHVEFKDNKMSSKCTDKEYINSVVKQVVKSYSSFEYSSSEKMPILIGGDISCYFWQVEYFFSCLRTKIPLGKIIYVLGNHELWCCDEKNRKLFAIIRRYRNLCKKYKIILLHNELILFYDKYITRGIHEEKYPYAEYKILSEQELKSISVDDLKQMSCKSSLMIFGGIGFSGYCKDIDKLGRCYNAEAEIYRDIIPTLREDIKQSRRCEKVYKKINEALTNRNVIIFTHMPFTNWTNNFDYNPNFIYVSGHTHRDFFEVSEKRTIYADNQVGYYNNSYQLSYFDVDGTYDIFKDYTDGIYPITDEQYIDFARGNNIQMKFKKGKKQVYMLKRSNYYMFVYYNAKKQLLILNGGNPKKLEKDIQYYYDNMVEYGDVVKDITSGYISALEKVSEAIKQMGGSGKIHGCIVDIDPDGSYYSFNHLYINPYDGCVVPYFATDKKQKYVFKDLNSLIEKRYPQLLPGYNKWSEENKGSNMLIFKQVQYGISGVSVFEPNTDIYTVSNRIKLLQYIIFQNIIREWNDNFIIRKEQKKQVKTLSALDI